MPISCKKLAIKNRLKNQLYSSDEGYDQKKYHEMKKASYIGKSTETYYQKYGPSAIYTKAAKCSLPINKYFTQTESDVTINTEINSNILIQENLKEELVESIQDKNDILASEASEENS
ncbi:6145_t:CDS:2, partial [Diversispora eburnea]